MSGACAEAQIKRWPGNETPALAQPDISGRTVDLRDLRGRVVLVNFWATWCDPCRDEMPSFERLRAKLDGKPFEVITVNYGEAVAKIEEFMRRYKLSLTVLLDPDKETAAAWKAGGLPMTFLVDAQGKVRYSAFGECDWSAGEPLRIVENLLAEAPRAR
ncbi:MAG: TlpA disulfide reductase family protein [Usitatibacter sp.]